ncbi:MAG: hypothetical protein WCG87_07360 [Bacteroidota bacterium]
MGNKLFNEYRDKCIAIIKESLKTGGKSFNKDVSDVDVIKTMKKNIEIEFVKANVYIRFGVQRIYKLPSRIANVTIFAVNNPTKNIAKSTIKEYSRGKIS